MRLVYYCSGHGYGHATRVSAFASHLLRLDPKPTVHIVSSAPELVFSDSIALGALYRYAHIDPVIVQPLAYRVDRVKSVEVLKTFLDQTPQKIKYEVEWLQVIRADCVLSDAAFLGCAAANAAGIPSVLITNFTFDSVFSYLSTPFVDGQETDPHISHSLNAASQDTLPIDLPIPRHEVEPLVRRLWEGYRCADLLLRLPGAIPMPSFAEDPGLPSPDWVDIQTRQFQNAIYDHLIEPPSQYILLSQIPFPSKYPEKAVPRSVLSAPLLVRSPNPTIYTDAGRKRLLDTLGVPLHKQNDPEVKVLIVSFGGQIFHKPSHSRTHSRAHSQAQSRTHSRTGSHSNTPAHPVLGVSQQANSVPPAAKIIPEKKSTLTADAENTVIGADALTQALQSTLHTPRRVGSIRVPRTRDRSQSLLLIPGAPAASVPSSPLTATLPSFPTIVPPTPRPEAHAEDPFVEAEYHDEVFGTLLPDASWLAVVCGVPKDWAQEDGEALPDNFFVAPKDVYMPDLTAVADVLLGKLGYGTVSECVDACTPFVFVPRPLFIEEHGLRLLLEHEGVGVELSRTSYESGEWAAAVEEAYLKGREAKARKRAEGETGKCAREGKQMAEGLVKWIERWEAGQAGQMDSKGSSCVVEAR